MSKKTLPTVLAALALMLGLAATTQAQAGEALEALRGAWTLESVNGEQLPQGASMSVNFNSDTTFTATTSFGGEKMEEVVRYTATADGNMTIYQDETDTEGESGTWEVKDGKLHLSSTTDGVEETIVLARP